MRTYIDVAHVAADGVMMMMSLPQQRSKATLIPQLVIDHDDIVCG